MKREQRAAVVLPDQERGCPKIVLVLRQIETLRPSAHGVRDPRRGRQSDDLLRAGDVPVAQRQGGGHPVAAVALLGDERGFAPAPPVVAGPGAFDALRGPLLLQVRRLVGVEHLQLAAGQPHDGRLPHAPPSRRDHPGRTPGAPVIVAETHPQTPVPTLGNEPVPAGRITLGARRADEHHPPVAQFNEIRVAEPPVAPFPRPIDLLRLVPRRPAVAALAQRHPGTVVAQAVAAVVSEQDLAVGKLPGARVGRPAVVRRRDHPVAGPIPLDPRVRGRLVCEHLRVAWDGHRPQQAKGKKINPWTVHECTEIHGNSAAWHRRSLSAFARSVQASISCFQVALGNVFLREVTLRLFSLLCGLADFA